MSAGLRAANPAPARSPSEEPGRAGARTAAGAARAAQSVKVKSSTRAPGSRALSVERWK